MPRNGLKSLADPPFDRTDTTLKIRLPQDRRMDFRLTEVTGCVCLTEDVSAVYQMPALCGFMSILI